MLFKYSGKYVNIYFNMKITFFMSVISQKLRQFGPNSAKLSGIFFLKL